MLVKISCNLGICLKNFHGEQQSIVVIFIPWDTTEINFPDAVCESSLSQKIKKAVLEGEQFHEVFDVIPMR